MNYYDSIEHAIASLVFQAFGVPPEAVELMLTVIEEIKYFLWTAYGDSKSSSFKGSSKVAARLWQGGKSLASQFYVHIKGKDVVATLCVLFLT